MRRLWRRDRAGQAPESGAPARPPVPPPDTTGNDRRAEVARVINASPDRVWAEMRDFIGQMRHFGLAEISTHSGGERTDAVGAQRTLTPPGMGAIVEVCTAHSDASRTFSLTLQSPNPMEMDNYLGTVSLTALSDGNTLARYTSTWSGKDQEEQVAGAYTTMFSSVATAVQGPPDVAVVSGGRKAPSGTKGQVAGKVALVTGGAMGLGAAFCRALAAEGARAVIIVDKAGDLAREVAGSIPGGHWAQCDITDPAAVDALFASTCATFGRLDVVVNNAGIAGAQVPTAQHPLDNWHKVLGVNLHGAFYVLRAALARMEGQDEADGCRGSIVNIASTAGRCGMGNIAPYTAAKAALIHLTKCTAVEYGPKNIRVNAVAPTVTSTPLVAGFMEDAIANGNPEIAEGMKNMNPMPGMPVPEEVAPAIVYLASTGARWVSGVTLEVDGAFCAGRG